MNKHSANIRTGVLAALTALMLLSSCKKEDSFDTPQDAIPKVETLSAELTPAGTIRLKGNVVSAGAGELKYVGFCSGKTPSIGVLNNQILLKGQNGTFSAEIDGIEPDDTMYFNTFVANKYAYGTGTVKRFIMPHPEAVEAPCNLDDNSLSYNGFSFADGSISSGTINVLWGQFAIRGSWYFSGGPEVTIEFNRKKPINGEYTVGNLLDNPNNMKLVSVRILDSEYYYCQDGGKVYVTENPDGSFDVTFCDLKYTIFNTEQSLRGRMLVK